MQVVRAKALSEVLLSRSDLLYAKQSTGAQILKTGRNQEIPKVEKLG